MTIVEFLLARIAEDEQAAWRCTGRREWVVRADREVATVHGILIARSHQLAQEHIAQHDPARVLAECEAKRRILVECSPAKRQDYDETAAVLASAVLWHLARPYADHPDYDEAWRP